MDSTLQTVTDIDDIEIARTYQCSCTNLHKHININKNDLTIVSQNIRSIYCNFDDLTVFLASLKFESDILILTECRLDSKKPIPQINNYYCFATNRKLNQNDGVVVYVRKSVKAKVREICLTQASCLELEVLDNIVLCIYRSPSNTNTETFIDSLNSHLNTLKSHNNIIIAGDININLIPRDNDPAYIYNNRANYLNMLSLYGILPGHVLPTRESNCLDHFMIKINRKKALVSIAILHTTITDHYTTLLCLSKIKTKRIINKTTTTIDFEQALKYLIDNNIAELLFCNDPDQLTQLLLMKLTESLQFSTTTKTIPNSKRTIKPWITTGILRCIKNRNKLQQKSRNDPFNDILIITYRRYRNHCNNLIKKLKRKYERELLGKSVNNNKLLWKNIKSISYTNNSKSPNIELLNIKSSSLDSVNFINNYFTNIGKDLAEKIQNTSNYTGKPKYLNRQVNSFTLLDTDNDELSGILTSLKTDIGQCR